MEPDPLRATEPAVAVAATPSAAAEWAKPQHPVLVLVLGWFGLSFVSYLLMGQVTKCIWSCVLAMIFLPLWCCCCLGAIPSTLFWLLFWIDSYLVAAALSRGEQVGMEEYRLELAYKLLKLVHKDAAFSA